MAEAALHARPEYDYDVIEGDIHRRMLHFDYSFDESLIPAIGTLLTGTDTLLFSLIRNESRPDPKSTDGRRRLLVKVFERTEYVT